MNINSNGMEPNTISMNAKPKASAKDFFINLGAIVALYTTVVSLLNLLFTVINVAYPQITSGYYYNTSSSISFPVATLIIFFPIYILLMWLLEKDYRVMPEKKLLAVRRWLTYITLFIAGLTLAIDLVWVLYRFIDGQELTTAFLLKAFAVLVMAGLVFFYYISDIRKILSSHEKKSWVVLSCVLILASIIWGFSVLGSPRTQQLLKYDEQKVSDLQNINSEIQNYYQTKNVLPATLTDLTTDGNYFVLPMDEQTQQPYIYIPVNDGAGYQICAVFNKAYSQNGLLPETGNSSIWTHPAGEYCFTETVKLIPHIPYEVPVIPPTPKTVPAR